MRHALPLLLALTLLPLAAGGCQAGGTLRAAAVDSTFRRVADRHDRYVDVDPSIGDVERRIALRDTALLRAVLDAAKRATTTQPTVGQ